MGCITSDWKENILSLIDQETERQVLRAVVSAIPLCAEPKVSPAAVEEAHKRKVPEVWGIEPVYYDETGKAQKYSSPSALVRALGLPMSGIQCDAEGKKCRVSSAVEILQVHGYVVTGNGEPKKASEGGKKLTVYHPKAPQLKKLQGE